MGPWSPNWRPDPTGRRLEAIRVARRGALLAAVIFGVLVAVAVLRAPAGLPSLPWSDWETASLIAVFSLPALALLGAGLTAAAIASRSSAVMAGLAMAVGAPVAAVTSAIIAVFVAVAIRFGVDQAAEAAGRIIRGGVIAAAWISPLMVIGAVAWVVLVRRFARGIDAEG
jgi:hypothetical protein